MIVPFIADQPFWGKVVHELGVGQQPIPQKKLTTEGLSVAISLAVNDANMRRRADAVGEKIQAENGTGNAVKVIARVMREPALCQQAP